MAKGQRLDVRAAATSLGYNIDNVGAAKKTEPDVVDEGAPKTKPLGSDSTIVRPSENGEPPANPTPDPEPVQDAAEPPIESEPEVAPSDPPPEGGEPPQTPPPDPPPSGEEVVAQPRAKAKGEFVYCHSRRVEDKLQLEMRLRRLKALGQPVKGHVSQTRLYNMGLQQLSKLTDEELIQLAADNYEDGKRAR